MKESVAAIHAGFGVLYREAHLLFEEIVLATLSGRRVASAAEDLLELMMRCYEGASTVATSNRPLEDWPTLFGDAPTVAAFLDRMMHHRHLIYIKGKSYRLHENALANRQRQPKGLKTAT